MVRQHRQPSADLFDRVGVITEDKGKTTPVQSNSTTKITRPLGSTGGVGIGFETGSVMQSMMHTEVECGTASAASTAEPAN